MGSKSWETKLARALQRLVEDEIGKRPALMTCHAIVREDLVSVRQDNDRQEEIAARLFELRRDRLIGSAERKART
jgi:hypothetical protein